MEFGNFTFWREKNWNSQGKSPELTKTKLLAKPESMTGHLGERIYTCMFTCQK